MRKFFSFAGLVWLSTFSGEVAVASINGCAGAEALGAARWFNLFVLEDLDHRASDTEGFVRVGRNATLMNYDIGAAYDRIAVPQELPYGAALTVGGSLNIRSATVRAARTVYGSSLFYDLVTFSHGVRRLPAEVDFAATNRLLGKLSKDLAAQPVHLAVTAETSGDLLLSVPAEHKGPAIFRLEGEALARSRKIVIEGARDATVVVNVFGVTSGVVDAGFRLNGVEASRVIFNFPEATYLRFLHCGLSGIFLAPNAVVRFTEGNLDGLLVARSLFGGGDLALAAWELERAPLFNLRPDVDFKHNAHGGQLNWRRYGGFTGCLPVTPSR